MNRPAAGILPVRRYGDPCLRERCVAVPAGEDVSDLARAMTEAMLAADGVGLAAPQVGDPRRVVLVADPGQRPLRPLVLVNPEISERSGPLVGFEEGCLSFPELFVTLLRPRNVCVRYRDLEGQQQTLRDDGILARIVQHEVDHLDGVLYIDHLPRWRRWLLGWRLLRLRAGQGEDAA